MIENLVSVVIPAYNYAPFIGECIESVYAQTYPNWEIVIVDDGSEDDTPSIVEQYVIKDPSRIKYLRLERQGVAASRNHGIANTQGEFIMPLDADDVLETEALAFFVEALRRNSQAGFAYSNLENYGCLPGCPRFWLQGPFYVGHITHENTAASASMWRRSLWEQGVCYRKLIFEDWDLWLQIVAKNYCGAYVPKVLFKYRLHIEGRTSKNKYLYFPAFLQVITHNPSLYNTQIVDWAKRLLVNSPRCWDLPTIAFLPDPKSNEYYEFSGLFLQIAQEFLRRGHFIVSLGQYPFSLQETPGIALLSVSAEVNLEIISHKLGMIGAQLVVFSALSEVANRKIWSLPNVDYVLRYGTHSDNLQINHHETDLPYNCELKLEGENFLIQRGDPESLEVTYSSSTEEVCSKILALSSKTHDGKKVQVDHFWRKLKILSQTTNPLVMPQQKTQETLQIQNDEFEITFVLLCFDMGPFCLSMSLESIRQIRPRCKIIILYSKEREDLRIIAYEHACMCIDLPNITPFSSSWAYNVALRKVETPWVCFLEKDSLLSPGFIPTCMLYLKEFGVRGLYLAETMRLSIKTFIDPETFRKPFYELAKYARFLEPIHSACLIAHREWLCGVAGFDEEFLGQELTYEEICLRAEIDNMRIVWMPVGHIVSYWDLPKSSSKIQARNKTLIKDRKAKYLKQVNVEGFGDINVFPRKLMEQDSSPSYLVPVPAVKKELLSAKGDDFKQAAILFAWGNHLFCHKEIESALCSFEDLLDLVPHNIDAMTHLAKCYLTLGNLPRAGHYIQTVLWKDPGYQEAQNILEFIHSIRKQHEQPVS